MKKGLIVLKLFSVLYYQGPFLVNWFKWNPSWLTITQYWAPVHTNRINCAPCYHNSTGSGLGVGISLILQVACHLWLQAINCALFDCSVESFFRDFKYVLPRHLKHWLFCNRKSAGLCNILPIFTIRVTKATIYRANSLNNSTVITLAIATA